MFVESINLSKSSKHRQSPLNGRPCWLSDPLFESKASLTSSNLSYLEVILKSHTNTTEMLIQESYKDITTQDGGSMRIFTFHPQIPNYPKAKFPGVVVFSEIYQGK